MDPLEFGKDCTGGLLWRRGRQSNKYWEEGEDVSTDKDCVSEREVLCGKDVEEGDN